MDHDERSGESIGALLSSLATTLREVSNKLDAVAAHVDDDRNLAGRLAKLEAWAFRTGEDVSKIGSRLEQVVTVEPSDEPAEPALRVRPEPVPATRERREPIPSRRDRLDAVNGRADTTSAHTETGRNDLPDITTVLSQTPTGRNNRPDTTGTSERLEPKTGRNELITPTTGANGRLATPTGPLDATTGRNERLKAPEDIAPRPARTEFTAPITRTEHLEPFGPATPNDSPSLPSRTPQPVPPAVPPTYRSEPLSAPTSRPEWLDSAIPAGTEPSAPTYTNSQPTTTGDRLDFGSVGSSNGRLEPLTSPPRNGYESPTPTTRPDTGMTAPRTEDNGALSPGAHRAGTGEDTSHVDKLQAMLDELKRNPHGPFGRPDPSSVPNELPGVDPNFAIRTEG
ncbi:hypothetical protein [Nocardia pseudovaccinii]|uniref:hypothetical protein n=1 Tax=Nocardia pseudovaccinii TaxID=189540 RepID=UPI0007A55ED9|nr:hypothetical protein [Nocardia pseudovaccinii]